MVESQVMFCPQCQSKLPNDTKFCSSCGAAVSGTQKPYLPRQATQLEMVLVLLVVLSGAYLWYSGEVEQRRIDSQHEQALIAASKADCSIPNSSCDYDIQELRSAGMSYEAGQAQALKDGAQYISNH